jgi:hypothetical protein
VLSTSGAVAKLLALQVFCLVVILSRLLSSALLRRQLPALKIILGVKLALLIATLLSRSISDHLATVTMYPQC